MQLRFAIALIFLAAAARLLPHPHNFTPIAAMGLFGAAYLDRRWAFAVPFVALFLSDLVLNNVVYKAFNPNFTWITSGWIYAAFALVSLVGMVLLRNNVKPVRIVAASLISSMVFFLITNFSVWFEGAMYPKNGAGLMACFTAGLPFLQNTIMGDLLFSGVLFGLYAWQTKNAAVTARESVRR
jgi:hypothetical protein